MFCHKKYVKIDLTNGHSLRVVREDVSAVVAKDETTMTVYLRSGAAFDTGESETELVQAIWG